MTIEELNEIENSNPFTAELIFEDLIENKIICGYLLNKTITMSAEEVRFDFLLSDYGVVNYEVWGSNNDPKPRFVFIGFL